MSKVRLLALSAAVLPVVAFAKADLFIGTQGLGNVTPAAAYPFGLVQPGPDTSASAEEYLSNKGHCGGYQHDDGWIWRFSQMHISGTGCTAFGDFGIMPFVGEWDAENRALELDKALERAEPGYYAVGVKGEGGTVRCEMTALAHTAVYRFVYPKGTKGAKLLFDNDWLIRNNKEVRGTDCWAKTVSDCRFSVGDDGTITGGHRAWNWNDYEYHFAMRLSAPVVAVRTLKAAEGQRGGIYVLEFGEVKGGELIVRIALSSTSSAAAIRNLEAEAPLADFGAARAKSAAAWAERLDLVTLDPSTPHDIAVGFETSLYRLFVQPNLQSDVGDEPRYSTFSLWDTFRAAHPLYTVLCPEENAAFVRSMLDQYDRQGYLPIWALGGSENHCMIGHHAVPVIVDACLKGLLPKTEHERAYRAIRNSITVNHRAVNDGTWGLMKEDWDVLDRYGYYPFDKLTGSYGGKPVLGESVARTYECAYDDACAARLAASLGHDEEAAFFTRRSQAWTNVFDTAIGYARGKDSAGRWREPFNRYDCGSGPWAENDFCEGGSCQYTWHVMQDPERLIALLGGKAKAGERLDGLFADKVPGPEDKGFNYDISGCIGQYVHGNEPSHHIIYFYAFTDRPERMGERIAQVFATQYQPKPDGLCGNDDCGQMSAWYIFSALGFYPFDPASGVYVLGVPQVPKAVVRLGNGKRLVIRVEEYAQDRTRVGSVRFNGRRLKDRVIRHDELLAGGELVFEKQ